MADPLYELLQPHLESTPQHSSSETTSIGKYLSRLVSLRLGDLTTTEPQSLAQAAHSNLVSIQALSSRSHRTTTTSSDHLTTLRSSIPQLTTSVESIKKAIPELDISAVSFASSYSKARDEHAGESKGNALFSARRNASLLSRQADKVQDILELPSLLRASIAAANISTSTSSTSTSGANYTQALDLFAHIKRLQILYPDSALVKAVLADAEIIMKDMTTNLIASLRGPNLRLAAAIRMIGWLRRVAPELSTSTSSPHGNSLNTPITSTSQFNSLASAPAQNEGHFGALFLVARLYTFLSMTEALAPLRDLADQETQSRKEHIDNGTSNTTTSVTTTRPQSSRTANGAYNSQLAGQQTERYLKRYIEIFREQSFATISMYRNIFPADEESTSRSKSTELDLELPPALQTFPMYLIDIFMDTLKQYLPNVTDPSARESLLMQVLYAANSLGRLGADFSLMIAALYEHEEEEGTTKDHGGGEASAAEVTLKGNVDDHVEEDVGATESVNDKNHDTQEEKSIPEPEWVTVIKKHRIQAARLEALAAGQERAVQGQGPIDIAVR